jgi:hypothetical protein
MGFTFKLKIPTDHYLIATTDPQPVSPDPISPPTDNSRPEIYQIGCSFKNAQEGGGKELPLPLGIAGVWFSYSGSVEQFPQIVHFTPEHQFY